MEIREKGDRNRPKIIAAAVTVVVHLSLLGLSLLCGMSYMYPPPAETGILIQPISEPVPQTDIKPVEAEAGVEPRTPKPNPDKPVELVQKSEAQQKGEKQNLADEATVGDKGDIDIPEPPRKKEIDKRALFSSAKNSEKDTLAAQTAERISDALTAGHPEGNTKSGTLAGEPSAQLAGRQIMGSLPLPSYSQNESGTVVIRIIVDASGNVTSATIQPKGTTVSNSKMREAAREAALKAKFSTGSSVAQEGTITYIFHLK
ncbi:MAG: TonB family protein [Bacteroidales bacterium]|jgi:TonB family protein|nr:TonB family protein [Bacteroidales bacterium]MCI2121575.1 TonB family protein [Bacteroidales bacterium]MCI2145707.1 TonB family protein [Bacteroidales bacterium]